MPALACCVDAAVPPCYALAVGEGSPPVPESSHSPAKSTPSAASWSPELSASLYKIDAWGAPYFSVNSSGHISVRPYGSSTLQHQEMDLMKIIKKATDPISDGGLGLRLPLIVRLPDVLESRLRSLQFAFDHAIRSQAYSSHYQGVFPVKCNQDRFVVEDIVRFGSGFGFGLESGSKPELVLAMSCLCKGSSDSLLICNGFKDADYISLALVSRKLGFNTVLVLEQEEELDLLINLSRQMGVQPVIGLRAKLRTKHSGHFGSTSGEKGKFGLTATQIMRVVKKLENARMLNCLQLLHFHIGSQIPSTELLADGVGEAAQIYCELVRLGAGMRIIDVGGGLGVDYDGSQSPTSEMSVGYGIDEYAAAVVEAVRSACDQKFVKHPIICSESGRALVSHHSVLVFEAVSSAAAVADVAMAPASVEFAYLIEGLAEDALVDYRNLTAAALSGERDTCLIYAEQLKRRCVDQFKEGLLGLECLAAIDSLCELVVEAVGASHPVRTYNINLSLFTSIPDFWAIDQLFPIVPIHRLDELPGVRGVLLDLTCDSDGKVDRFINKETSLPLHDIAGGRGGGGGGGGGYYLGMFLGGAYQEALGGMHNLFGGPSVVRVLQSDGPHGFAITSAVPGLSCADVLRAMQHEPEVMFETLKRRTEECLCKACSGEEMEEASSIASRLFQAFHSMPYLVTANGNENVNGIAYRRCEQDSKAVDGDDWTHA